CIIRLIRADAVILDATNDAVIAVEVIEDPQRIVTPGRNVAGTNRYQTNQIKVFRQRLVVVAASSHLHVLGVAPEACEFKRCRGIDTVTRVLLVIDRIVDETRRYRRTCPGSFVESLPNGGSNRNITVARVFV